MRSGFEDFCLTFPGHLFNFLQLINIRDTILNRIPSLKDEGVRCTSLKRVSLTTLFLLHVGVWEIFLLVHAVTKHKNV